jgi:hypothetical protein
MNQVLSTLIKILREHPDASEAQRIRVGVINATVPSVMLGEPRSRLKASLIALEHLVRKDALPHVDLMQMLCDWLQTYHERWRPSLGRYCEALSICTAQFLVGSPDGANIESKKMATLRILILGLLVQATNSEFTSAIGSLLALLCERVNQESDRPQQSSDVGFRGSLVVWVDPVKYILLEGLDTLEAIPNYMEMMSNHILLPLFSLDVNGFRAFIHQLPVQILLSGDMNDDAPHQEFVLLFSALQVAKKLGLVHEDCELS